MVLGLLADLLVYTAVTCAVASDPCSNCVNCALIMPHVLAKAVTVTPASSAHARCVEHQRPASQPALPRRRHLRVPRSGRSDNGSTAADDESGTSRPRQEERVVSVSGLLAEVQGLGEDFVFEDKDEDIPVWGHEERLRAQNLPEDTRSHMDVKNALDPSQLDAPVSAYSVDQGFQETTVEQVHEALQQNQDADPLLLDVRTPQEYRSGHAPSAINIELDALSEAVKAGTLDDWKDQGQVLVICQGGKRSAQAAVRLNKVFGFQQVVNVKGGTAAWIAAGYPIEQGDGRTLDAPPHLQS